MDHYKPGIKDAFIAIFGFFALGFYLLNKENSEMFERYMGATNLRTKIYDDLVKFLWNRADPITRLEAKNIIASDRCFISIVSESDGESNDESYG